MKLRSWLIVIVASAFALGSPRVVAQDHCRERRNVDKASMADLKALADAIQTLKSKTPDRYEFWKNVHGRWPEGPCIHGDEQLLPWHRAMLAYFELELRAVSGNSCLALVYWDWTQSATGKQGYPQAFDTLFPNGTRNDNSAVKQPAVDPAEISSLMKLPWDRFTEGLEGGPHDGIHSGYVGGDMGSVPTAANDVIFYAHHANLDRLWAQHQASHPKENPANAKFETSGFPKVTYTNDILDLARMQYTYDSLMSPRTAQAESSGPRPPSFVTVGRGAATAFPVNMGRLDGRSVLVLEKVPVSSDFTAQGVAYLHPEAVAVTPSDPDFVRNYYAGYFFIWKRTAGPHSSHRPTRTVVLNVGTRYDHVPPAQRTGNWIITVVTSRVPSKPTPGAMLAAAPLTFSSAVIESADRHRTPLKAKGAK